MISEFFDGLKQGLLVFFKKEMWLMEIDAYTLGIFASGAIVIGFIHIILIIYK